MIPEDRNLISQFYRQIGNAVSPPCVAAVLQAVASPFLEVNKDLVFDLVLQATPRAMRDKVLAAIQRKQSHSKR